MNHKEIYEQIPAFECPEGCTDCCGPMQHFDEWELSLTPKKLPLGYHCPYKTESGCEIYDVRPFICRFYGSVEGMECKHGHGPEQLLSREEGKLLTMEYNNLPREKQNHENASQ